MFPIYRAVLFSFILLKCSVVGKNASRGMVLTNYVYIDYVYPNHSLFYSIFSPYNDNFTRCITSEVRRIMIRKYSRESNPQSEAQLHYIVNIPNYDVYYKTRPKLTRYTGKYGSAASYKKDGTASVDNKSLALQTDRSPQDEDSQKPYPLTRTIFEKIKPWFKTGPFSRIKDLIIGTQFPFGRNRDDSSTGSKFCLNFNVLLVSCMHFLVMKYVVQ